jgi:uncharacterized HhH-GPD family protein
MAAHPFPVTGDPEADQLLVEDPFARLLGMLLDQQITMEMAFAAPARLRERLDGTLDPATIVAMDPDDFDARFRVKPALHRFPGSMSKRVRAVAQAIVDDYAGDTERIWTEAADGADLFSRLRALPGFGDEKARIFVAVLAKRFDVRPDGWEAAAGPFADDTPRSVADIDSPEGLLKVRAWKKAQKAKGLGKSD